MRATQPPWLSYLCLAAGMALVGCYVALSKSLVLVFPVFLLAWLRFGIAAMAMAGWVRRAPAEAPLSRRDRRLLFAESFFGNFLFSICMLSGVALTSALAAGVIMAAIPASSRSCRGSSCASTSPGASSPASPAPSPESHSYRSARARQTADRSGATCCCSAPSASKRATLVIGKKLTGNVSPKRISALINLWGLALITPFGLWQARSFAFDAVSIGPWSLLVFYSIAASVVTVWLWMTGLKHVPAASAGVFTVLLPVSAALVGVLFLGEHINAMQAVAFGLALAGVVLATWPT